MLFGDENKLLNDDSFIPFSQSISNQSIWVNQSDIENDALDKYNRLSR